MPRAVLLAVGLLVGGTPAAVSPSPSPSAPVAATASPSPSLRTGTPLVPEAPSVGIAARGAIEVPANARLIAVSAAFSEKTRVWLVHPSGANDPVNVAAWRGPPAAFPTQTPFPSTDIRTPLLRPRGPP